MMDENMQGWGWTGWTGTMHGSNTPSTPEKMRPDDGAGSEKSTGKAVPFLVFLVQTFMVILILDDYNSHYYRTYNILD